MNESRHAHALQVSRPWATAQVDTLKSLLATQFSTHKDSCHSIFYTPWVFCSISNTRRYTMTLSTYFLTHNQFLVNNHFSYSISYTAWHLLLNVLCKWTLPTQFPILNDFSYSIFYTQSLFPLYFVRTRTRATQFSTHKDSFYSIPYIQKPFLLNFLYTRILATQFPIHKDSFSTLFLVHNHPCYSISFTQWFLPLNFMHTKTKELKKSTCLSISSYAQRGHLLLNFLYTMFLSTQFPKHKD